MRSEREWERERIAQRDADSVQYGHDGAGAELVEDARVAQPEDAGEGRPSVQCRQLRGAGDGSGTRRGHAAHPQASALAGTRAPLIYQTSAGPQDQVP